MFCQRIRVINVSFTILLTSWSRGGGGGGGGYCKSEKGHAIIRENGNLKRMATLFK